MRGKEEEVVNAVTHLFASFITFFITALLVIKNPGTESLPIFILGSTASWAFFGSFFYHGNFTEPQRSRNRDVDIAGIYIMIAGSGISICLTSSSSLASLISCFLIFLISAVLITKFCLKAASEALLVSSGVLLSWLSIMPAAGLFLPTTFASNNAMILLLIGGGIYSLGIVFYIRDSKKWYHTAWHVCVMCGFSCHYIAECMILGLV